MNIYDCKNCGALFNIDKVLEVKDYPTGDFIGKKYIEGHNTYFHCPVCKEKHYD